MGDHHVDHQKSDNTRAAFIRHLLNDIKALEEMERKGLIEDDIVRIGAEQEFCLLNENWRPAKNAQELLRAINDPHFTTELACYNLEINLDPEELTKGCFTQVEQDLKQLLHKAKTVAEKHNTRLLLTGILPTISKSELTFDYMTPDPRYWALNNTLKELRGGDFELRLRGVDELAITHDSVLFEACNTSFQIHLQIKPEDFVASYNWSQAIAGPVLGICANSPLLLGRELWSETRIALFQQSIDTRNSSYALRDRQARVAFGKSWAQGSIADIFKDAIAEYTVMISRDIDTDSLDELKRGNIPKLKALALHNSTIYRWNRACYGVGGGKPHVRIENRYIPAGPSVIDQLANFAFWVGLMIGRPGRFDDMAACMDFRDAKANFMKAARTGKESVLRWGNKHISVRDLVTDMLLPIAHEGLKKANIDRADRERLLDIIAQRAKGMTGAQWKIKTFRQLRQKLRKDNALLALTKSIYTNQQKDIPVHEWPDHDQQMDTHEASHQVKHIMSTQLFTVKENDLADLATSVMEWKKIHHVPVENSAGELRGLLTWTHMKRHKQHLGSDGQSIVGDIMAREVVTVDPKTEIQEAIRLMKQHEYGCLPVAHEKHLVGIITIQDVLPFDRP